MENPTKEFLCPHCRNPIYDEDALLCHFCGESLGRSASGIMGKVKSGPFRWLAALIALVVAVSFLLLILR